MVRHKAHRIVRKLAQAGQKHMGHAKPADVTQQLAKVKALAAQPNNHEHLSAELRQLEEAITKLVSMQGELVRQESQDSTALKKELRDLRLKLHLLE